jgi:hypothetical protein
VVGGLWFFGVVVLVRNNFAAAVAETCYWSMGYGARSTEEPRELEDFMSEIGNPFKDIAGVAALTPVLHVYAPTHVVHLYSFTTSLSLIVARQLADGSHIEVSDNGVPTPTEALRSKACSFKKFGTSSRRSLAVSPASCSPTRYGKLFNSLHTR